jgi:hypothetical protein
LTEYIGTDPSKFHLYIANEDDDNGCDFLENTYMNAKTDGNNLSFITRNSDIDKVIGNHHEANNQDYGE